MADENLTSSAAAFNPTHEDPKPKHRERDDLAEVLRRALSHPQALGRENRVHLQDALQQDALQLDGDDHGLCELALATIAALLYSRPELVDESMVNCLADLLMKNPLPERVGQSIVKLFTCMAAGPLAPRAWSRIAEILGDPQLDAKTRDRMLPLAGEFAEWCPDIVGLDGAIALAESAALAAHRTRLFDDVIERIAFTAPEVFTGARMPQIAALFSGAPRYPHVLYSLRTRPSLPEEARNWIGHELEGRFPHQQAAAAILKGQPVSLLVVLNVGMGQGDDMVRIAPLLQGLLDANPALAITFIAWRPYLYDNARITPIAIGDDDAIKQTLTEAFDGVIEFFQPEWMDFTFRIEVHSYLERYLAEHHPALVIKGDLGRACEGHIGGRLAFLHQTVKLGAVEIAQSRGLDQCLIRNVYDPTMRLMAELGLPYRVAEDASLTPAVLTGTPSGDAERVWADLIAPQPGSLRRPFALVNPFGGSGATKGFHNQDALIAAEISGLVDEGFLVVMVPNSQEWGRRSTIEAILSRLEEAVRAYVRIAPDPADKDDEARLALTERSSLEYRDRAMRMLKYFASYADLIVTVEGWLAHLAYISGRPMRLLLAAGSFSSEYHPRFRGPAQRLVAAFSPKASVAHAQSALLREEDQPPLPHRPRKSLLEMALDGLGRFGDARDAAAIRLAQRSPDPEVRTWAVAALGRVILPEGKAELLTALDDPWSGVWREAASALLRSGADCSRELGPHYRELLQGYIDVDQQKWDAVRRVGPGVLPALFKAAKCEVHDVKHGAKVLLAEMLSPFVGGKAKPRVPIST